jgi:tetratricopeptide (TPR) repeat protein
LIKSASLLSVANLSSACLQFYCLGNTPKAQKYLMKIERKNLPSDILIFRYDLLKADITLINKGLKKAYSLYKQIKPVSEVNSKRPELVMSGTMIAIQNCYVLKNHETAMEHCEILEASFPVIRLQPDYLLLKAKILKELKQSRRAMNVLLRLLKTDPTQKTAANANWKIAQFYYKDKQYSAAEKRLNDILTEAPRSREAAESAVLMEKLKRELRQ